MQNSTKKRLKFALISIGSTIATASVMSFIFSPATVFVMLMVLFAHEYGHFFAALGTGAHPYMPIFIPLVFFVIGMTFTDKLNAAQIAIVAMAGPLAGLAMAFILAVVGLMFGIDWFVLSAILAGVFEVWSLTVGGDGQKYRNAKKASNR